MAEVYTDSSVVTEEPRWLSGEVLRASSTGGLPTPTRADDDVTEDGVFRTEEESTWGTIGTPLLALTETKIKKCFSRRKKRSVN